MRSEEWALVQQDWFSCEKRKARQDCARTEERPREVTGSWQPSASWQSGTPETSPAGTWILDFQPPKPWGNAFLLCKLPSLWLFCYGSFDNLMQICDLMSSTLYYHPHFQIQRQKHQRRSASWLKLHSSWEVELELNPSNDFRTHIPNSWWNTIKGHLINIYSDKKKRKITLLSEKSTVNTIYLAILLLSFALSKQ